MKPTIQEMTDKELKAFARMTLTNVFRSQAVLFDYQDAHVAALTELHARGISEFATYRFVKSQRKTAATTIQTEAKQP